MKSLFLNPLREMEELLSRYTNSSQKLLGKESENSLEVGDWMPVVDIHETDNQFIVKAELPGVEKEDVTVSINNGILTIKGEKHTKVEDQKSHRIECEYGSFLRSFNLPSEVKTDNIEAKYKDGVLTLELPKSDEHKSKQIEVKIK